MKEHARLIKDLGGGTAVARSLTYMAKEPVDREAVYKWQENGIPWRWRPAIGVLAQEKNVALPSDFLDAPGVTKAATG